MFGQDLCLLNRLLVSQISKPRLLHSLVLTGNRSSKPFNMLLVSQHTDFLSTYTLSLFSMVCKSACSWKGKVISKQHVFHGKGVVCPQ